MKTIELPLTHLIHKAAFSTISIYEIGGSSSLNVTTINIATVILLVCNNIVCDNIMISDN